MMYDIYLTIKEFIKKNRLLYLIYCFLKKPVFVLLQIYFCIAFSFRNCKIVKKVWKQDERFEKIKNFKGIHKGKRCFIVATGPSMTIGDLEALKDEYTISMNSIISVFSKTSFRPSYYVFLDRNALRKSDGNFGGLNPKTIFIGIGNVGRFVDSTIPLKDVRRYPDVNLFHDDCAYMFYSFISRKNFKPQFSLDSYKRVYDGTTVTFAAIQIAAYMGFSEIYLVGVDCNYHGEKAHFVEYNDKPVQKYSDEDADAMYLLNSRAYRCAYEVLKKEGIRLCNATRGGMLKEIPRIDLDMLLGKK